MHEWKKAKKTFAFYSCTIFSETTKTTSGKKWKSSAVFFAGTEAIAFVCLFCFPTVIFSALSITTSLYTLLFRLSSFALYISIFFHASFFLQVLRFMSQLNSIRVEVFSFSSLDFFPMISLNEKHIQKSTWKRSIFWLHAFSIISKLHFMLKHS